MDWQAGDMEVLVLAMEGFSCEDQIDQHILGLSYITKDHPLWGLLFSECLLHTSFSNLAWIHRGSWWFNNIDFPSTALKCEKR